MTATPEGGTSPFLPTFRNLDVNEEQLKIVLSQFITNTSYAVNIKQNGQYETIELLSSQQFTDTTSAQKKRQGFRKIFYINPSTLTFNHNITGVQLFTNIYGVVAVSGGWYPLPLVDTVNVTNQISIQVTSTQVIITSGATAPVITGGLVVLEYVKN
jgi:hypothetical protein